MDLFQKINAFASLGEFMEAAGSKKPLPAHEKFFDRFENIIRDSFHQNGWFTEYNVRYALRAIGRSLQKKNIEQWLSAYPGLSGNSQPATIGVIMAGNIPLAGFHDFACVLFSGNKFLGKLSSDDKLLLPAIAGVLTELEPGFTSRIVFTEGKIEDVKAVIATGNNNSARYFEYYFSKFPHIIRKNRNSVAVLDGNESEEELSKLGEDIFTYYGLGCRNVSKLFVPAGYDFNKFFRAIYPYHYVLDNKKYANNYEYNRTIYLMNKIKLLDNNFLLLREDISLHSPVAMLYYEYYRSAELLAERLHMDRQNIQCIVSGQENIPYAVFFGSAQQPSLRDYADQVDTLKFLLDFK